MSPFHLLRACKQTEGVTPHAMLLHLRVASAVRCLLRPGARAQDVAAELGFSSSSHFIRAFRQLTGVTPGALQRAASLR